MTGALMDVQTAGSETGRGAHFVPTGVFMELDGRGTCFFRQHLNPGKPTLLLVHGMVATSGLNWFRLFPALSQHFNIIAPDLRGHGRSSRDSRGFNFHRSADDMAALIRELEVGPVIAVGYSLGGAVVQHLWRRHPELVSGLVLAATNYKARVARREEFIVLPFFAAMIGFGRMVELMGHLPKGLIKRFLPRLADQLHESEVRWMLDEMRRTSLRTVAEAGREMALHDAADWLDEIDVPTAVVITERDRVIPPARQYEMVSLIEAAEFFAHDDGHVACTNPDFGQTLARACLNVAKQV